MLLLDDKIFFLEGMNSLLSIQRLQRALRVSPSLTAQHDKWEWQSCASSLAATEGYAASRKDRRCFLRQHDKRMGASCLSMTIDASCVSMTKRGASSSA